MGIKTRNKSNVLQKGLSETQVIVYECDNEENTRDKFNITKRFFMTCDCMWERLRKDKIIRIVIHIMIWHLKSKWEKIQDDIKKFFSGKIIK